MTGAPKCQCGVEKRVTLKPDVFVCMNCDGLQSREVERPPRERLISKQDIAYEKEMTARAKKWYPGQNKESTK